MNIVDSIYEQAQKFPKKKAIVFPREFLNDNFFYDSLTYEDFVYRSRSLSYELQKLGISKGTKVLLFLQPSLHFSVTVFSLFRLGAIPVFIDPGAGLKKLLGAVEKVKAEVLIAEPKVHILRKFFSRAFSSVKLSITAGKASFWTSKISLPQLILKLVLRENEGEGSLVEELEPSSVAAIAYTSGATGKPKGVQYTHEMFFHQVQRLKECLDPKEEDVDLSCFPLFSLSAMAMGMTSVIPKMNAAKPATVDPSYIVKHVKDQGVRLLTGSPAIWDRVADYCIEKKIVLKGVRAVLMFGAPVSLDLHERLLKILDGGETYTPYGATEALPISWVSGSEILQKHKDKVLGGEGVCLGKVVSETKMKISSYKDEGVKELEPYKVGEILVSGGQVTQEYFEEKEENLKAKVVSEGSLWHRMGDLGYKDKEGLLWFCGRKSHYVSCGEKNFYSVNCELIFNQHPEVRRSALIGLKDGLGTQVALAIERYDRKVRLAKRERERFKEELKDLARGYPHTKEIQRFFLHKSFPVDCRHNIKIDRIFLSKYFENRKEL